MNDYIITPLFCIIPLIGLAIVTRTAYKSYNAANVVKDIEKIDDQLNTLQLVNDNDMHVQREIEHECAKLIEQNGRNFTRLLNETTDAAEYLWLLPGVAILTVGYLLYKYFK